MDGHDPAEDHWWYNDDYPGEAATIAAAEAHDNFIDMFGNSIEGLFELVWEGGTTGQPALSRLRSSPPRATAPIVPPPYPEVPSEEVMAAWLYPIVSGLDHAGDSSEVPARVKSEPTMVKGSVGTMTSEYKGKIPATDLDTSGIKNTNMTSISGERRKAASGGSSRTRSSQHSVTHNSTEKRRRCKISDRLKTLQQLVPGCDKSNQASTLEQTIQYMKSLQQQVHSMNMTPAASAAAAVPVYPVVQPPMPISSTTTGQVRAGATVPIVPYGAMIPYAHYHAVMMPAPASSALPVMMPALATSAAAEGQCSIPTEQQWHKKEKGKRRL